MRFLKAITEKKKGNTVEMDTSINFMLNVTNQLPDDMIACSLCLSNGTISCLIVTHFVDFSSLIISRLEKGYEPLVLEVPILLSKKANAERSQKTNATKIQGDFDAKYMYLNNLHSANGDYVSTLQTVLSCFDTIINEHDASSTKAVEMNKTDSSRRKYWATKDNLDNRMDKMIQYMEKMLMYCWKSILLGSLPLNVQTVHASLNHIGTAIASMRQQPMSSTDMHLLRIIFHALPEMPDYELHSALSYFSTFTAQQEQEIVSLLCKYLIHCMTPSSPQSPQDEPQAPNTTIVRSRKKKTTEGEEFSRAAVLELYRKHALPRKHLVLILDKLVQRLPWEYMPCLRNLSISRMPNLFLLSNYLQKYPSTINANLDKTFYVLNPKGDLKNTEDRIRPSLSTQWQGIVGSKPEDGTIYNALSTQDVFLFFGHGAGEIYYSAEKVRHLDKCATAILMGCSSGILRENGEFDPYGVVLNYLIASSPCVVGCLWDVTDKDIDELAKELLQTWQQGSNLCQSLSHARTKATMRNKFLNGSATVCYGLPVHATTLEQ